MKVLRIFLSLVCLASSVARADVATFAGGCFWCMEPPFAKTDGVTDVKSGYTGGTVLDPSYEMVSSGGTGHAESVEVTYDPKKVTYEKLLDVFWRSMDPTDADGQFADRGNQYRPAIFYHSEAQRKAAVASKEALGKSGKFTRPIATEITAATKFYPAEEYHQHFWKKNPVRYYSYKALSGREGFLERTWGKDPAH